MTTEKLLYSIGMIDDRFIEEAAPKEKIVTFPETARKSSRIWQFASVAACAVLVFAAIFSLGRNGLMPTLPSGNDLPPSLTEPSVEPSSQNTEENPILYPLTLNKADAQIAASIYIPGHFWYELTHEQLGLVFPDLPLSVTAAAHYRGDGSLFNITAYEASDDGSAARFNELYTLTEIQIAPDEIVEDVIYEYEAQTSDVYGVPVVAGVFYGNENDGTALYIASFKLDGTSYYIKLHDSDKGESGFNRLTEIVNSLIKGGAADLSVLNNPVIPELRDEQLTLDEAHADSDFGAYLPEIVPNNFKFESARRFINQEINGLFVNWIVGYKYIEWRISIPTDYDREHIVSVKDREKYDMSLYTIPLVDSVPEELREYVDNPVFLADELTLDVVRARAYQFDDKGDTSDPRMNFSVIYGDLLISVSIKGVSADEVWNMLSGLTGR